jgi:hypothetical protein
MAHVSLNGSSLNKWLTVLTVTRWLSAGALALLLLGAGSQAQASKHKRRAAKIAAQRLAVFQERFPQPTRQPRGRELVETLRDGTKVTISESPPAQAKLFGRYFVAVEMDNPWGRGGKGRVRFSRAFRGDGSRSLKYDGARMGEDPKTGDLIPFKTGSLLYVSARSRHHGTSVSWNKPKEKRMTEWPLTGETVRWIEISGPTTDPTTGRFQSGPTITRDFEIPGLWMRH